MSVPQVREQEMVYEKWQAGQIKERKATRRQKLHLLLEELWCKERETKVAELVEECSMALHCIGEGRAAAILVMQLQEGRHLERARQLVANQHREVTRYKIALEKERLRRKLESKPKTIAKRRKKVKDFAAQWERRLGRFASYNTNFKLLSRPFLSGMPLYYVHNKNLPFLQPSDYKHTFLHSRFFMDWDEADVSFKDDEIDAWKAAEVQRQIMKRYKILQGEIKEVMNKRKVLRGIMAGSKAMIDQKIQIREHANHLIERSEKENKRNTLCQQNVEMPSKVLSRGVEHKVHANHNDEVLKKADQDVDAKVDQDQFKHTFTTSCCSGLAKQKSSIENLQEDENHCTSFFSCPREVGKNNYSKLSTRRASQEHKSKVLFESRSSS